VGAEDESEITAIRIDRTGRVVAGGDSQNDAASVPTFSLARFKLNVDTTPTEPPAKKSSEQIAAEARAAHEKVVAFATSEILAKFISEKPLTVDEISRADIFGVTSTNIDEINRECATLSIISKQDLRELTRIVYKYATVANIADHAKFYASDLVAAGFLSSESKYKTQVILKLRLLPSDQIDSPSKINAIVAAVTKLNIDRKARITEIQVRVKAHSKK